MSENCPHEYSFYYQVLIDSDDWNEMHFPYNLITCLHSNGMKGQKNKLEYNGMDIVSHDDILPFMKYQSENEQEMPPIKNEHFSQIFSSTSSLEEKEKEPVKGVIQCFENLLLFSALLPQSVYRCISEMNEIQVLTFYLGVNRQSGHDFHFWRCLFRIRNLGRKSITLKDIKLETSTMSGRYSGMEDFFGEGPSMRLTPSKSSTQFALHFEMPCQKGNLLCGYFVAKDDQNRIINLEIPMIPLEGNQLLSEEQMETV